MSFWAVLVRSIGLWGRSFVPFTILSVLLYLPWIALRLVTRPQDPARTTTAEHVLAWCLWNFLSLVLGGLVASSVLQRLSGRAPGPMTGVRRGLASLPGALRAGFVASAYASAPMLLGWILEWVFSARNLLSSALSIFGLVATCQTFVAVPVAVAEGGGALHSVRRSFALTRGYKWPIFGILFLIGAIVLVAPLLAAVPARGGKASLPVYVEVELALAVLLAAPLFATTAAVAYHDLRRAKEGLSSEEIARVFD